MKFGVCILSNYKEDQQQSMLQYADLLETMLKKNGIAYKRVEPTQRWGELGSIKGLNKYLRYIDKYLFFRNQLLKICKELRKDRIIWVVHIVDHSNALYVPWICDLPVMVTCHDVGAIQGARGELEDCPASFFGKILQNKILSGLIKATHCVAVSEYTKSNLSRLSAVSSHNRREVSCTVILNPIPSKLTQGKEYLSPKDEFDRIFDGKVSGAYILNVGSNLRRKNREVVLKVFSEWSKKRETLLVFVGEHLTPQLWEIAHKLGVAENVIDLGKVSSPLLSELYRRAFALLFPSRFEGFGWPIIEGQALGTPVIAGNNSAIPEVAGKGAFLCDSEAIPLMIDELVALENQDYRSERIRSGYQNLERFRIEHFEKSYLNFYEKILFRIQSQTIDPQSNQVDKDEFKRVKIVGLGACMMSGYPFPNYVSFYHHAIQRVSKNLMPIHIDERNCTISGCSLIQASGNFEEIIYSNIPDIAIIQFGGVDASVSIRSKFLTLFFQRTNTRGLLKKLKLEEKPNLWHIAKWKILGMISSFLRLEPTTPMELYLETFLKIIVDCKTRGIEVIAVTPFRMGNSWSDHYAKLFSEAVEKASIEKSFECLNSWKTLYPYPLDKILLVDGFHLTRYAHEVLGNALHQKVEKLVKSLEKS